MPEVVFPGTEQTWTAASGEELAPFGQSWAQFSRTRVLNATYATGDVKSTDSRYAKDEAIWDYLCRLNDLAIKRDLPPVAGIVQTNNPRNRTYIINATFAHLLKQALA